MGQKKPRQVSGNLSGRCVVYKRGLSRLGSAASLSQIQMEPR